MRGRLSSRQCFKWASRAVTLDEVLSAMRKHKVPGNRTAVWRFFQRHKITFKSPASAGQCQLSASRGGASKRKNPPAAFPKNRG
jgi:hypothetical protein